METMETTGITGLNAPHLTWSLLPMRACSEHGFQPEFPAGTDQQLAQIKSQPALPANGSFKDLRNLLWSSIDNDTSKDLDQIEWAEQQPDGSIAF